MSFRAALILLSLTFGVLFNNHVRSADPSPAKLSGKLDEVLSHYAALGLWNGTALIAQNDSIVLNRGYGVRTADSSQTNDASTVFLIYSATKPITATVVLKLVDDGKLSLDDPINKFFPDFSHGGTITVRHLLSHTSGLYDFTRGNDLAQINQQTLIPFLAQKPLDFEPGSGWNYSNSGYYLLGFIIEKVTGKPYEQVVEETIFRPLGMRHSGFGYAKLRNPRKAVGFTVLNDKTQQPVDDRQLPDPYAAGGIYSTTQDLQLFGQAILGQRLLKPETQQTAFQSVRENYGLGWIVRDVDGKRVVSHSGGADGFRSNLLLVPQDGICLVLLDNHETQALESISGKLLDVMYNRPVDLPREVPVPAEILERYVGTYQLPPNLMVYVSVADGRLVAQPAGQRPETGLAKSNTKFYFPEADLTAEFVGADEGDEQEVIIDRQGDSRRGKRVQAVWGILGTATPLGWEGQNDLPLDEQEPGLWVADQVELTDGEFKFRLNNDWTINFGQGQSTDGLVADGPNIRASAGTYKITLDLRDRGQPKFELQAR
ncbi:MAG: serine hydrolase [Pirellulales bacterium]